MRSFSTLILTLSFSLIALCSEAQNLIWYENFDGLANQTTNDEGATAWSVNDDNLKTSNFNGDTYFGVEDGAFLAKDLHDKNDQGTANTYWQSEYIDIRNNSHIFVYVEGLSSFNIQNSGGFEAPDYIEFLYRLDNDPQLRSFGNNGYNNGNFEFVIASSDCDPAGLSGDRLQIVIKFSNSSRNEFYYIDNIKVISDPDRPAQEDYDFVSIAGGDWDEADTWDIKNGSNLLPGPNDKVLIECNAIVNLTSNSEAFHITVNSGGALMYYEDDVTLSVSNNGDILIRDAGLIRKGINSKNNKIYKNSTLDVRGNFTLVNNAVFNQVEVLNIRNNNSIVNFTGNGKFAVDEINFTANQQEFYNASWIIVQDQINGIGNFSNLANATLEVYGTDLGDSNDLALNVSTIGNEVIYSSDANQNIFNAATGYWHLTIDGSKNKTTKKEFNSKDIVIVRGDLTIRGDARFELSEQQELQLSGNWIESSIENKAFSSNNGKVTFTGSNAQTIINEAGEVEINNLKVNKPGGRVTLLVDLKVTKTLELTSGIIYSDENALLLFEDNAEVIDASQSSYIDGPVVKTGNDAFVFPVGNLGTYAPIGISAPIMSNTSYSAQYFNQCYADMTTAEEFLVSNLDYWLLEPLNNDDDVQVTLYWENTLLIDHQGENDLFVAHYDGTHWESLGREAIDYDLAAGSITSPVVTDYSPFTVGSHASNSVLPISLVNFRAKLENQTAQLQWSTSSEENFDYFLLERSQDGVHYEEIAQIKGNGWSQTKQDYHYSDFQPLAGISYYRLTSIDFDGYTEVFPPTSIVNENNQPVIATLAGNVVNDNNLELLLKAADDSNFKAHIYDNQGRFISSHRLKNGRNGISVNASSKGVFIVKLEGNNFQKSFKFILN